MRAPRTPLENLETVCGLALALLVLAHVVRADALRVAALGILAAGLWRPAAARVARAWTAVAAALGRINAWVFLGATYLLVVTPLALARRLVGQRHPAFREGSSAWLARERAFGADDFDRPA